VNLFQEFVDWRNFQNNELMFHRWSKSCLDRTDVCWLKKFPNKGGWCFTDRINLKTRSWCFADRANPVLCRTDVCWLKKFWNKVNVSQSEEILSKTQQTHVDWRNFQTKSWCFTNRVNLVFWSTDVCWMKKFSNKSWCFTDRGNLVQERTDVCWLKKFSKKELMFHRSRKSCLLQNRRLLLKKFSNKELTSHRSRKSCEERTDRCGLEEIFKPRSWCFTERANPVQDRTDVCWLNKYSNKELRFHRSN